MKIRECASFIRGVSYSKSEAKTSAQEGFIPIVRANNIVGNKFLLDDLVYVPQALISTDQMIKKNDIVITMSSGSKNHIGKIALASADFALAFGAFCGKLRPLNIFPKFLEYLLQSGMFRRHIEQQCKGTNINNIKQNHILDFEFDIPEQSEQERIVAKIEELFSQLDAAVAELKSVKEKLVIYRQAVLSAAWNSVSGAPMKKTEDICFFITKGTTPPKSALLSKGEVPFLKVYNLTFDNTLDFSIDPTFVSRETHENFLARSKVLPGDVLMNIVGPPLGKVSIVPQLYSEWNINQAIARFRCSEEISNSYLAYFLGSAPTVEKIKNKAKATAGQFNLTLEICRNIDIPVPTLDEQLKIVQEIEEKLSVCNNIEQTVDIALQQATALRQSILKQAFEGKL